MQETESEQTTPTLPTSQSVAPAPMVETIENDDDPDVIFMKAVAEINTQPLVKSTSKRTGTFTIADVLEVLFLGSVLLIGFFWSTLAMYHVSAYVSNSLCEGKPRQHHRNA